MHKEKLLYAESTSAVMTHKSPVTIDAHALAAEALAVMNEKSITSLFVADKAGKPVGIIHIHDCLRAGVA